MELHCMQSPTARSIPRSVLLEKPCLSGQTIVKFPYNRRTSLDPGRIKFHDSRVRASGTTKIKSQAQDATTTPSPSSQKDGNTIFVAGATGKVGSRTVRELLKLGFNVRAGVRSTQRAQSLVQSVKNLKLDDDAGGTQPIDKFELVECDLEKPDQILPALANSLTVICCIGASEKEIFDITGPYRIDYLATKYLIDAATSAKVEHFILLTSLGTNKVGFPAAILNLFWGVLFWKRKAEEALLASGLPYTIVRPGGMERPTDSFKETHNLTLSEGDTLFGGLVSNLQVAELLAFMAKNRSLSCCKVVEVVAETTAPLTPMGDLLKTIPSQREDHCNFKESDNADESKSVASDKTYSEKEVEQVKATKTSTPLSPYAAYEDLKPPTSPTPTPSSGSGAAKIEAAPSPTSSTLETSNLVVDNVITQIEPKKSYPSSPYINYEDLKPPSSPTPTPPSTSSGAAKASKVETTTTEASSSTVVESLETSTDSSDNVIPLTTSKKPYPLSPYINYEDLKPPTSPSPTPSSSQNGLPIVATTPVEVASGVPAVNDVATSESTEDGNDPTKSYDDLKPPSPSSVPIMLENNKSEEKAKARPLSPYTMYEDLKPPSSPSPKKL